jgi:4-hydroxybenzoate polyprenyltransferase
MASAASTASTARPSRLRSYLELVRFSHTIFALPFAIMAVLIAARTGGDAGVVPAGLSGWLRPAVGILLCMVSARTAAMAFNRLVDRTFDAANPRTASRHLPRGALGVGEVLLLVVVSCTAFVCSTLLFLPNWLPLALSLPVLACLLGYSYAKRFTMLAHVWLGAALGLAPVTAWVAGFDTIYACQDAAFDAAHGLQSIPARLGVPRALSLAAILHGVTLLLLSLLPAVVPQLGPIYWCALAAITALLVWEHSIVRPDDLSRVNEAFFNANALIGVVLLAAIAADLWW